MRQVSPRANRLISNSQAENVSDLFADCVSPFGADVSAPAKQLYCRDSKHDRAITKRLPIHSVRAVQHYLVRLWQTVLSLARAIEHVDYGPGAKIGMGYEDHRMFAPVGEIKAPNFKLRFHSGTCNVQPFSSWSISLS